MMRTCLSNRSLLVVTYVFLHVCCHGDARDILVGVVHTMNQECHLAEATSGAQELNSSEDSDITMSVVSLEMNDSACALQQAMLQHPLDALILLTPLPPPCFCENKDGPRLPPMAVRAYQVGSTEPTLRSRVLDMFPSPEQLAIVLIDVMEAYGWRATYVLYNKWSEFYRSLEDMQNVMTSRRKYTWFKEVPATISSQADINSVDAILSDVRKSGRIHVILMTDADVIYDILEQAFHRMLLTSQSHWIITSFDARERQLDSFRHSGARFTLLFPKKVIRIAPSQFESELADRNQTEPPLVGTVAKLRGAKLNGLDPEKNSEEPPSESNQNQFELGKTGGKLIRPDGCRDPPPYTARLARDSVIALSDILSSQNELGTIPPSDGGWGHGNCSQQNHRTEVTFRSPVGDVSFDGCGRRTDFTIHIHEYSDGQAKEVGFWTTGGAAEINSTIDKVEINPLLGGQHLQVYGRLSKPFIMERKHAEEEGLRGRDRYEGFMLDLADMLAVRLNFTWNLTMGLHHKDALSSGEYDLVLWPMSVRTSRLKTMQLSIPLRTRGYFLTMKRSDRRLPGMFQFMAPFSKHVWMCYIAAIFSVSLLLAINNRFNPYEWGSAAKRGAVEKEKGSNLNLSNSIWSTWGAAVGQGPEFLPRSYAGRVAAGTWWFFVLVAIASYTANLAAFLSQSVPDQQIKSLTDLAAQTDVPYGTYKKYKIVTFFQGSSEEPFKTIGKYLTKNADQVLSKTSRQAMDTAIQGDYIFISPTTYEYEILKERCDMVILTSEYFFKYQVALPFPLESPHVSEVNIALMKMAEDGEMDVLENRWFNKDKNHCKSDSAQSKNVLGMDNFGGLFYFLTMGMAVAALVFFIEWIWFMFRRPVDEPVEAFSETGKNKANNNTGV